MLASVLGRGFDFEKGGEVSGTARMAEVKMMYMNDRVK